MPPVRPGVRLGVDVGDARVGLAASDPAGILATPVATLRRDRAGLSDLDEIVTEAREREVLEVVVGLPRTLAGTEGVAAQAIRDYASALHRRLGGIPVRLVDERLSTVDAHRALHASGVPGRQHRARVDQAAAVVILQAALDSERNTGRPAGETLGGRKPRARRSRTKSEGTQP
nr:Holliday junction resolvase RuvX [Ornithinimicrobium cavernae]